LILPKLENKERAFLLQPIWKTKGKSAELDDHCLDVFVWSNTAFLYFILDSLKFTINTGKISRQFRSLCWLYKMLIDYKQFGKFNAEQIINDLTYHTKNDKAFAVSGKVTQPYMKCTRLCKKE
jgi:type II restriction enzyme